MKRIHIVALQTDRKAILERIQRWETVEVRWVEKEDGHLSKMDTSRQTAVFERGIQTAKSALDILDEKAAEKKELFAPRRQVDEQQYRRSAERWKEYLGVAQDISRRSRRPRNTGRQPSSWRRKSRPCALGRGWMSP